MAPSISIDQLRRIGGAGPLKTIEWRIRVRLNWHGKARSAVRHLLHGERQPSLAEAKDIEAAHLLWCAQQVEANRRENLQLYQSMRSALAAMEAGDAEFYRPHIEALRQLLLRGRSASGGEGEES
jgi:hypothetical protein